jgi:general secretion pathway protein D
LRSWAWAWLWLWLWLWAALSAGLGGCAEKTIHRESQSAMARGDHEGAVQRLEAGLRDHPESTALRSSLLQARTQAMSRLLSQAASLRSQGRPDALQELLVRARDLDPGNPRIHALLAEVATTRRQDAALAELEPQLGRQSPELLQQRLDHALKEDTRHPGLQAFQRSLERVRREAAPQGFELALADARPITLDFRDASLRMVLDVVSRHSGINFVIDRDVRAETRITVLLREARVEDALDLIIGTGQLARKVVDARTLVIYPDTAEKRRQYQDQVVRVFHLASADAKGAAAFLRAMLGLREPFVDERSNMLALREAPENIRLAERLIALYDTGEPEVLLDVEVLEVSSTRLTELGVKFPDTFSLTALPPAGGSGLTLGNLQDVGRDRIAVGVAGLLIKLRREVGDFTTLANPSIRVRNRQQAKILVGDKIPVVTTTTGTGGFVSDSVNYLDVGLKLEVEPTVFADDEVAIKVALEVSSLGPSVRTGSGTLAYQIGTRSASTLLRLRDGETQLLAGLISREERMSASRVPGVGDLPVLGRLFSSQQDNGSRTELVLAITPRILRNQRRLDASEAELWVGTESQPRLRRPPPAAPVPASEAGAGAGAGAGPGATPGSAIASPPLAPPASPGIPGSTSSLVPPAAALRWQGPAEVPTGGTVDLELVLDSRAPLRGLPLELSFDPRLLRLVDAFEGDYFRRDGAATSFSSSVDADPGRVRIGVLRTQATGAAGQGTVVRLRFQALEAGSARVAVVRADPVQVTPGLWHGLSPVAWTLQVR